MQRSNTQPNAKLIRMTLRINKETYDTVSALAEQYNVKKADVIRMAIDNSLLKYLGRIRYIDDEQAKTINANIIKLGNTLIDVRDQLRRIGVNYNREIKLRNAARKKKAAEEKEQSALNNRASTMTLKNILAEKDDIEKEIQDIMTDVKLLDKEELEALILRTENAIKEAGEILCAFQTN